jgi:S1-C subfamily serine protease
MTESTGPISGGDEGDVTPPLSDLSTPSDEVLPPSEDDAIAAETPPPSSTTPSTLWTGTPQPTTSAQSSDVPTGVTWPNVAAAQAGAKSSFAPLATPATSGKLRPRQWMSVAVVAALIGGAVGGAIAWSAKSSTASGSLTILQTSSNPGSMPSAFTSIPALVQQVSPSVVSIDVTNSQSEDQGTGMIISKDGLVVTNNHVIAAAAGGQGTITVTRTGTTQVLPATLLGTDPSQDVALLKIQGVSNMPRVTFGDSRSLQVGAGVVAIGNALGLAAGTPTVTQGIVSALGRTVTAGNSSGSGATETLHNMIQTDAAINPGNSGGPLIDAAGHVIGMNTAVAGATNDGTSAQNIGFAIPAARIERLLPSLLTGSTTPHRTGAYMGVFIVSVTPAVVRANSLSVTSGAYVQSVVPGLPAAAAGIHAGDVIVSINGQPVANNTDVSRVMRSLKPGQTVPVEVVRGTQHLTVQVVVGTPPS